MKTWARTVSALLFSGFATAATAEPAIDQIRIIVGTSAGATYDAYARLLARHMSAYLPNHVPVTVQNMAGAGGLSAANFLYNVAPHDGSTIGIFARGLPMQPLLDPTGVKYDSARFNWLGSPASEVSLVWAWHTTPFRTFNDLLTREMIIPATGPGADSITFPYVLNAVLGTKFKVVSGYPGGPELLLAVDRGEAEGIASTSWNNFTTAKKEWVRDGKARFLLQLGLQKEPEVGDVPLVLDMAKNDLDRRVLELIFSRNTLAYPIAAPPGVPSDRLQILQKAIDMAMADPALLDEARQENLKIDYVDGPAMTGIIARLTNSSPEVLSRAREAIASGQR